MKRVLMVAQTTLLAFYYLTLTIVSLVCSRHHTQLQSCEAGRSFIMHRPLLRGEDESALLSHAGSDPMGKFGLINNCP